MWNLRNENSTPSVECRSLLARRTTPRTNATARIHASSSPPTIRTRLSISQRTHRTIPNDDLTIRNRETNPRSLTRRSNISSRTSIRLDHYRNGKTQRRAATRTPETNRLLRFKGTHVLIRNSFIAREINSWNAIEERFAIFTQCDRAWRIIEIRATRSEIHWTYKGITSRTRLNCTIIKWNRILEWDNRNGQFLFEEEWIIIHRIVVNIDNWPK